MGSLSEDVVDGMFRHDLSGLDYLWLDGGYEISNCGAYGDGVAIEDHGGLSAATAAALVASPWPLRGQECRYLRSHAGMTRGAFCKAIGAAPYQVAEWEEAGSELPSGMDTRVREVLAGVLSGSGVTVAPGTRARQPAGARRKLVARHGGGGGAWVAGFVPEPGACDDRR